jgi:V/A-type H+-transporting ATPase subunit D
MKRLAVPPTKSALLKVKRQMGFLAQAREMLERKRELLTKLVHEHRQECSRLREAVRKSLHDTYGWIAIAKLRMGSTTLRQAAVGLPLGVSMHVVPASSVGIGYPRVRAEKLPLQPIGLMRTDASFDEARQRLADLVVLLARLGEAETSLRRLVSAQRKTQRRVNALQHNVIPMHSETIRFIQSSLEEEERSSLFQMRVLRARQP